MYVFSTNGSYIEKVMNIWPEPTFSVKYIKLYSAFFSKEFFCNLLIEMFHKVALYSYKIKTFIILRFL